MLISTGIPGIHCPLSHLVGANQSRRPWHGGTCQSYLWQPGLSDHVRLHLSEPCLSELGLSETKSETMSELHMSEPHLSEPHLFGPHLAEPELIYHSRDCQIISEHTSQRQDFQRPCLEPCQSCTCQSRTCQGHMYLSRNCLRPWWSTLS